MHSCFLVLLVWNVYFRFYFTFTFTYLHCLQMTPATYQRCCSGWSRTAARCGPTKRLYCTAYECRTNPVPRSTRGPRLRPAPAAMPQRRPRLPHRHRRRPKPATICASTRTRISNSNLVDTTRVGTRVRALAEMLQLQLIERSALTASNSSRLQMLLLSVPPVPLARRQQHPNLIITRFGRTIAIPSPVPADQPTLFAPLQLALRTARFSRHQKYFPNPTRTLAHSLSTAASLV